VINETAIYQAQTILELPQAFEAAPYCQVAESIDESRFPISINYRSLAREKIGTAGVRRLSDYMALGVDEADAVFRAV
jgi:hypothetical protein